MKIKELTIQAFQEFVKNSPLKNYMQTVEYARFMGENKYNYDYIGLVDETDTILAASLILWKKIGFNAKYGYAPKGFLLNYYDEKLLRLFTDKIKDYYKDRNMIFIKINPEIVVGEVNSKTLEYKETANNRLKIDIMSAGYLKLKDNMYFESINPRMNAYVDLKNADSKNYNKVVRNKVRNASRKGLFVLKGNEKDLEEFYKLGELEYSLSYYRTMYNIYKENIDLILVRVNYENYVKNSQDLYERELDKNGLYNEIIHRSHKESDLHKKMASDSRLCSIKSEIIDATEGMREHDNALVAGALVIKYENRVHVVASAYDKNFSKLNANYFLYDALINNYKDDFDFLDLNGVSADFRESSPYYGLNRFKFGFNPKIYEFIGEFDLIINQSAYNALKSSGKLAQELNKKN